MYIDFSDDRKYYDKYMELLERIYNEEITKKPPLGVNPFDNTYVNTILEKTNIQTVNYQNPKLQGTITFDYPNNNRCYTIVVGNTHSLQNGALVEIILYMLIVMVLTK